MKEGSRTQDKIEVARRIANTQDGMIFIKYMIEDYIANFRPDFDNPNKTYFELGKQQFVKDFLKLVEDNQRFERVIISSRFDKKEDKP
jgi:hypothetical protein